MDWDPMDIDSPSPPAIISSRKRTYDQVDFGIIGIKPRINTIRRWSPGRAQPLFPKKLSPIQRAAIRRPTPPPPAPVGGRRIGGMFITIYASLTTAAVAFLTNIWGLFTGVQHLLPPAEIIAVETDGTGKKRRAIEANFTSSPSSSPSKSSLPTSSAPASMPGSFPAADSKTEAPAQLATPPDSRPGSSQDQVKQDTPMATEIPETKQTESAERSANPSTTSTAKEEKPVKDLNDWDWKPRDGRRPIVRLIGPNDYPINRPAHMQEKSAPIPAPAAKKLPSGPVPLQSSRFGTKRSQRRRRLPADAIPSPDEVRKPSRPSPSHQQAKSPSPAVHEHIPAQAQNQQALGASASTEALKESIRASPKNYQANSPSQSPREHIPAQSPRDVEIDALINKARVAALESPEEKAFRRSWSGRKALEQEGKAPEKDGKALEQEGKALGKEEQERGLKAPLDVTFTFSQEEIDRLHAELWALPLPDEDSSLLSALDPEAEKKKILVRALDPEWDDKVNKAMDTKNRRHVITQTVDGTDITRHDFGSLIPQRGVDDMSGWLNDEIVNAWMATIVSAKLEQDGYIKSADAVPAYVAFSSQWYSSYKAKKNITAIQTWSRRKAIKGKKLLQAEKIFFPVNTGAHWMLLIISPRTKEIEFLDSLNQRGMKDRFIGIARDWLAMELEDGYKAEEWKALESKSSWQTNDDDCGVFVCLNGLAAAKKCAYEEVGKGKMSDARRLMAAVLLNGGLKNDFML